MARILSDLVVKNVGSGLWQLTEPLEYHVGNFDSNEIIIVPKDFISDFASIPKPFIGLIPKDGKWTIPSILHDYIYSLRGKLPNKTYSRKEADDIFDEAMQVMGVAWWTRKTMYAAVRLFGGFAWKKESRS